MSVLNAALRLLKKEEERLERELSGITAAISVFGKTYMDGRSAQGSSTGGRARIAAHRARSGGARKTRKVVPIKSKRTMLTAGTKKAAAAQKPRPAKMKAAKKSA